MAAMVAHFHGKRCARARVSLAIKSISARREPTSPACATWRARLPTVWVSFVKYSRVIWRAPKPGSQGLAQKGYQHEVLPRRRGFFDGPLPYRSKYAFTTMPRVDWVAARLKRWLVGTHGGAISQAWRSCAL